MRRSVKPVPPANDEVKQNAEQPPEEGMESEVNAEDADTVDARQAVPPSKSVLVAPGTRARAGPFVGSTASAKAQVYANAADADDSANPALAPPSLPGFGNIPTAFTTRNKHAIPTGAQTWNDPIVNPRMPEPSQIEAYKTAMRNLNANVIKRFSAIATAGNGEERRAFTADEYLLEALWGQVRDGFAGEGNTPLARNSLLPADDAMRQAVADDIAARRRASRALLGGGQTSEAPPAAFQTPWAFFMEYAKEIFNKALVDAWLEFRSAADAYNFPYFDSADPFKAQNDIVEHPEYWLPLAQFANVYYAEARERAAWQHPTMNQMAVHWFEHMATRKKIRKYMVELGLRNGEALQRIPVNGKRKRVTAMQAMYGL
jgi:hypothetical protein